MTDERGPERPVPDRLPDGEDADGGMDLPYLATCVLDALESLGALHGVQDRQEGRTSAAWVVAHRATVLALQQGVQHLAQEAGE